MYFAINNLIDNLKEKTIRYHLLFLVAAVCYFISNILWGLEFTDGFFHINEAFQNEGYYPFETILSSQLIFLLNKIFGIHLVLYRLFNSLLILFSYYLIYNTAKKHYNKVLVRLFTAVFIMLASPMNFNILGFDSFSIITITVAVCFLLNNEMNNFKNILLLSILIACSMLVRMPNILLLPFTIAYFIYLKKEQYWENAAIIKRFTQLVATTLVLYIFYLLINYHSFSNIIHSFASQGGHNISKIIYH
jgi:4-amino-4-deoxy-L-arabinose transferase-like glycosyltransferase